MSENRKILPGTGRWQRAALTEGTRAVHRRAKTPIPSTILRMVPFPVPGRM